MNRMKVIFVHINLRCCSEEPTLKSKEVNSHTCDKCSGGKGERAGGRSEEVRLRLRPQGWKGEEGVGPNRQGEDRVCRTWGVGTRGRSSQPAYVCPVRCPGGWHCLPVTMAHDRRRSVVPISSPSLSGACGTAATPCPGMGRPWGLGTTCRPAVTELWVQ